MSQLLIICGPTAIGKTKLALKLAARYQAELISADSRQVYKNMDIGTGKEIDPNSHFVICNQKLGLPPSPYQVGYHLIQGVPIWLTDVVKPDQQFHLAAYVQLAWRVINYLWQQHKLPLIVGGTGLYLKALTQPLNTIHIPPNPQLRRHLQSLTLPALQKQLIALDNQSFQQMTASDQKNPRRLIRALEIKTYQRLSPPQGKEPQSIQNRTQPADILWLGLTTNLPNLYQKIDQRVNQRVKQGIIQEIQHLLDHGFNWQLPSFSALGYQPWQSYLTGQATETETVTRWQLAEHGYARRQLTWFKKNHQIHWFDPDQPHFYLQVVALTDAWYHYQNTTQPKLE